ncbi:hypothetical protein VE25_15820 [Devosia geojensis]|uniref:Uncharacterized protein n=1 Tax=Devosia geojensis TaxID=443610 RepID=A0A0F5FPS1_9HYPH|nr:hypothetical protein [Devosia geojensis]KKB10851.1 hypothetical protein VE25_15820 [Devosia geojensis]
MMRTRFRLGVLLAPLLLTSVLVPASAQEAGQQPPPDVEQPQFSGELDPPTSGEGVTLQGTPVPALTVPVNPRDLLTGLLATRGLAEICGIAITPEVEAAMSADQAEYIQTLGLTEEAATRAFTDIKSTLEARQPDCNEGSTDVAGVNEVLELYAARPEGDAAAPAAPAPAADAAAPAAPAAPEAPAPQ